MARMIGTAPGPGQSILGWSRVSSRAIARRLRISEGTVKDHVHQVLGGTGCDSRAAFIAAYLTGATAGPPP